MVCLVQLRVLASARRAALGESVAGRVDSLRLGGGRTLAGVGGMDLTGAARALPNARMVQRRGATRAEGVQAHD